MRALLPSLLASCLMGGAAATALLAAPALAVPAGGFTPDTAGQFAAGRAASVSEAANLDQATERLRAGFVLNPQAFLAAQSPGEQALLTRTFGQIGEREATHIAWYFRGALTHRVATARDAVLFYNPLADVAVLTTWRRIDGAWRITSARLIDGAALRTSQRGYWADDGATAYRQAVFDTARETLASTTEAYDPARPEAAYETLRGRTNALQSGLAAWRANPGQAGVSESVRRSLAAAVNPAPDGPSRAQMQALPPDVRRTLALTAVFRRADGTSLAFVSPLQPELLIFVDLDGSNRPVRTGPVNLANLRT